MIQGWVATNLQCSLSRNRIGLIVAGRANCVCELPVGGDKRAHQEVDTILAKAELTTEEVIAKTFGSKIDGI
jgi:hypothetical protein